MKIVDLHNHSTASDGSKRPSELVDIAIEKGLSAFALTDHDTTAGIDEVMEAGKNARDAGHDLEVIPGIELSTEYKGTDIHIVGLYIQKEEPAFVKHLEHFVASRDLRNEKMCARFKEVAGIEFTLEQLQAEFPGAVLTRAHFGQYLYKHGYISSVKEAFDRYIGDRGPCFIPREKVSPEDGISLILNAGGIPIFAHPILCRFSDAKLEHLVAHLKDCGLMGIEAVYSTYKPHEERQIRELAERYDLAISGGSDFHGDAKPGLEMATGYGKLVVPYDVLTNLKKKAGMI
ncbi:MAG: PHP domain-containing protein [Lachnospiraceae bacterium]|nr:PHP domain-containing protein [Lachnospiraceae bacterium]